MSKYDAIIGCGGRNVEDAALVRDVLKKHLRAGGTLIHGAARGADSLFMQEALADGAYVIEDFPVTPEDWQTLGKRAGPLRNQAMLERLLEIEKIYDKSIGVVAVHDDAAAEFASHGGTADMLRRSRKVGVPTHFYVARHSLTGSRGKS